MKLKSVFARNSLVLSLLLFTSAFIVSRILFLKCPLVEITYDSVEYSNFFDLYLSQGKLPPNDYLPLGYPFLIKCFSFVSNSAYSIVAFQMLVGYLGCILIIFFTAKYYKPAYALLTSIALSFFVLSPNNIYYDISVLSESLYNSSLLFITAFIIWAVNSQTKKAWLFLSLSLAIPVLFRPNGLFAVILFLLIIFYLFLNARKTTIIFTIPFLSVLILLSTYSFFVNGEFTIVSSKRVQGSTNLNGSDNATKQISGIIIMPLLKRVLPHYNHFNNQRAFYHKLDDLKRKYFDQQYVQKFTETEEFFFPITEVEKKRAFKEFYDSIQIAPLAQKQLTVTQGLFFKFFDYYQLKFESRFVTNRIWQWLMGLAFIYATFVFCKSRFTHSTAFILFSIICMNLGTNLIAILSTQRQLPRYEYPAEFLFHLSAVFFIILIQERRGHA